jgi:hypothetical protein
MSHGTATPAAGNGLSAAGRAVRSGLSVPSGTAGKGLPVPGGAPADGGHPGSAPPAVRVRGVRRSFEAEIAPVRALRGLDFDVAASEFVALMGPPAAGSPPCSASSPGSTGPMRAASRWRASAPSPALMAHYRANLVGIHDNGFVNALVRLKGGTAALPRFRADLTRVTGRSDIDVWDNQASFGGPIRRVTGYEAACLLAFGLAALAAAFFLIGQPAARYISATVSDLQILRAPGMTPRQATVAACTAPLLAAVAGASVGVAGAVVASAWMPIGMASMSEPHPGISADWLILGIGWAAAPRSTTGGRPGPDGPPPWAQSR